MNKNREKATISLKARKLKNGKARIYLRVRFKFNPEYQEAIDVIVDPDHFKGGDWQSALKTTHENFEEIRQKISKICEPLQRKINRFHEAGMEFTSNDLIDTCNTDMISLFFESYFELRARYDFKALDSKTKTGYNALKKDIEDCFEKGLTFDQLNLSVIGKFKKYLSKKGNSSVTIAGKLSKFQMLEKWYKKHENPKHELVFLNFKIRTKDSNKSAKSETEKFLYEWQIEQLSKLEIKQSEDKRYQNKFEFIRDLWVFMAQCGLRISDLSTLCHKHIRPTQQGYMIVKEMIKTDVTVKAPLNDIAYQIYLKWRTDKKANDYVFGLFKYKNVLYTKEFKVKTKEQEEFRSKVISTITSFFNTRLVTINNKLDDPFEFKLTCHVARHSFCTNAIIRGVPVKVVQQLAGHKDINTTLRYLHLAGVDIEDSYYKYFDKPVKQTDLKVLKGKESL